MNRQHSLLLFSLPLVLLGALIVGCGDYPVASLEGKSSSTGGSTETGGAPAASGGAAAGGSASGGSTAGSGGSTAGSGGGPSVAAELPCKILGDAGHQCVSAHSSVRVLVPDYSGPLYQLDNGAGTQDVGTVDGLADAAAHDAFCGTSPCTISVVYDQSGYGNHLTPAPPGSAKSTPGNPVNASVLPVVIKGRSVYGMLFRPNQGYRAACSECDYPEVFPSGLPVEDEPQTTYMVTSAKDLINGCCFDYGNASTSANNDGNGTMETVYFGMGVIWGSGTGNGPWVMADMENGLYAGWEGGQDQNISTNTGLPHDFVTAFVVGDTAEKNAGLGRFALYGGDATTPEIKELYDGIRPEKPGYVPMQKQGSLILGIGGDNSDADGGRFYEGVLAVGAATSDVVRSLSAAIAAAGYGK